MTSRTTIASVFDRDVRCLGLSPLYSHLSRANMEKSLSTMDTTTSSLPVARESEDTYLADEDALARLG